ncbi:hypothetical protein [Amycolatopsis sp. cg9]|uniref:hypothetical protein n=1 Tax=Amycolatopsis sp. cg9 TaxID=3238801 RepID=UPI0035249E12
MLVNVSDEPPLHVANTMPVKFGWVTEVAEGLEVIDVVSPSVVFVRELLPQPAMSP